MASVVAKLKSQIRAHQGVDSKTWTPPPFYGPLTIPEQYAFHAEHSPEHPVFVYDDEDGSVHTLRHKEVFRGIQKAAQLVTSYVPSGDASHNRVVGILAVADFPTFFTLILGTMYAGHTPFPISIRNSAPAVVQLLRKTSVSVLLVSPDSAMQRLAIEAKDLLAKDEYAIQLLPLPTYLEMYNDDALAEINRVPVTGDTPALILHSSGSTAHPKPITLLHRNFARWPFTLYFDVTDMCGVRVSMHCLPMFHMMGIFAITWPAGTGAVIANFRPCSPPIMATPETVLNAVVATNCAAIICVPAYLEAWARDPKLLDRLHNLKSITYAGGPLSKQAGDMLFDKGIKLVTGFGASVTEYGALLRYKPITRTRGNWEYFGFSEPLEYVRRYEDGVPGVFEPVILESPTWSPNVFNCEVDGRRAYALGDLFIEHPDDPDLFKVYGRVDDQITLSTGEKTNPVPMETIMSRDPHIRAAVMFGRGRLQNGVIIQPKEPFDPVDESKLEAFRNLIWSTIERANSFAPSHSRIFKEMIAVTSPSKPFQFTAKGTPRRHVSLSEYKVEIDELYRKAEESSHVDVPLPAEWTYEGVLAYVQNVVKTVLNVPGIEDGDDLFQQGCDSLQATWIRNTILHELRTTTTVSVYKVPLHFVYSYPTIVALAAFIRDVVAGKTVDSAEERAGRLAQMRSLADKYGSGFPQARWRSSAAVDAGAGEVFVITGTTGGLGSHILAELLSDPSVTRVYALNRETFGDSSKLAARQRDIFRTWGLDEGLLDLQDKVSLHVADFGKPDLGLSESLAAEIRGRATDIVHSAWRVDFNVTLPSFEPLIAGARNIVDFALGSPRPLGPRVVFVSSISALHNYAATTPAQETLDYGPELAVGQGYGESKWVTEQILGRARRETGLRTTSVRVGQLSGDSRGGGWNRKEWVPALVRASKRMGCVPASDNNVAWLPIDIASSAVIKMLHSDEEVLHLSSPSPTSWNTVFAAVAERIGVPLVPSSEWLAKLQESARAAERAPTGSEPHDSAHVLLKFFEGAFSSERNDVQLSMEKALKTVPSLSALHPLGKEDVLRWIAFWERVGFLKT